MSDPDAIDNHNLVIIDRFFRERQCARIALERIKSLGDDVGADKENDASLGVTMTPVPSTLLLLDWLTLVSILSFVAMGIDKLLAVSHRTRIMERTLWVVALLGGFLGIFLGGFVFRHKTSKMEFWAPVVASAVIWLIAISRVLPT